MAPARRRRALAFPRLPGGLLAKFLLVLIPLFLALAAPGFAVLLHYDLRDQQEALAARIGNQAARAATGLARHDIAADPTIARDVLAMLAADNAFICAELRAKDGSRILAAAPAGLGCVGQTGGQELTLTVGGTETAALHLRFSDAEIAQAEQVKRSLAFSVVAVSFLFAVLAASLGFRLIVGRPLGRLLAAIRRASDTGERIPVASSRRDELGEVIVAFNEMMARETERERALEDTNQALCKSQDELRHLNQGLESRIQARTADLELEKDRAEADEAYLRTVLTTVADAIITCDEEGRIKSFNTAAEGLFGYCADEAIGRDVRTLWFGEAEGSGSQDVLPSSITDTARAIGIGFAVAGRRKDGSLFPVETAVREMSHAGRRQFIAVVRDITERVETQDQILAAKRQAEAANEAKSQFLATMSHEIRTPLNGVLGMIQLLQATDLDSRQEHFVRSIGRSGNTLLSLVNSILDLAKIEAGKFELETSDFDPSAAARGVVAMFSEDADHKGITLDHHISPDAPKMVSGDGTRFGQILINLIGNAMKFTECGGIHVALSLLCATSEMVTLRIEVRDSGIGIAKNKQRQIFAAFEQADGSTTRQYGGTGLGLAITNQLVKLMGGEIGLDSHLGSGSLFWLTVPFRPAVDAHSIGTHETLDLSTGGALDARILLVEDNPVNSEIALEFLKELGCVVEVAEDGLEAVERFRPGAYDLVFMDCQMPRLDGFEATRRLREAEKRVGAEAVAIVAMTANVLTTDIDRCLTAGMNGHLAKPFSREQLIKVMRQWLRPNTEGISSGGQFVESSDVA